MAVCLSAGGDDALAQGPLALDRPSLLVGKEDAPAVVREGFFGLGRIAGYTLRPSGDGRDHGLALQAFSDVAFHGLGSRAAGSSQRFGASAQTERSLVLPLLSTSF